MTDTSESGKLLSREFLTLCLIFTAAFCNVSVYYSFFHYLGVIEIPLAWRGFLLGLEPMAAFVLRLFVLPWIHTRNALSLMLVSLILLVLVSWGYLFALSIPALIVLRIIHGGVVVLLTSAAIVLAVCFIPKEKSVQGFSTLSVAAMIPYAAMPPLAEALLPHLGSEADIYAGVSVFAFVAMILLVASWRRIGRAVQGMSGALTRRPTLAEIRENLRLPDVALLLSTSLLVFLGHAACFYFMKNLTLQAGSSYAGQFFMISMSAMILVRILSGTLFDRVNKRNLLMAALVLLVLFFVLVPHAAGAMPFYLLSILYGIGIGVITPVINALLFSASPVPMRGLNSNLNLTAMDTAYFVMPYAGGVIITLGMGFQAVFYAGAAAIALSLALAPFISRKL